MKRFFTKRRITIKFYFIVLLSLSLIIIFGTNYRINKIINDIISLKIEEQTNLIIKKNIVPKNVDSDKLVKINFNDKKEIIYSDINMDYANEIMIDVVERIQNSIENMAANDDLFFKYQENYYVKIPISIGKMYTLITNLGPKVPIKISFFDHSFGNIDVDLIDYGINNVLLKIYLTIDVEQKVYIPYNYKKINKQYRVLIASQMINGSVPNIYGGRITKSSSII